MGSGTIYLRGKTYWIQYYKRGRPYRESTKSNKKAVARALLGKRLGEVSQGKTPGINFDKVWFEDLVKGYLNDYEINERKSIVRAQICVDHLKEDFGGLRVPEITTFRVQAYIKKRVNEGAANGDG